MSMRIAGVCWSCLIALAAGFVRQSRASAEEEHKPERATQTSKTFSNLEIRSRRVQRLIGHGIQDVVSAKWFPETTFLPMITEPAVLGRRMLGSSPQDKVYQGLQGRKRDATLCPSSFQLCPASLNGGCCPSDLICDTSSCLPNTATLASPCGSAGNIACGLDAGGGCCPSQFACPTDPTGQCSGASSCSPDHYLCASSLGGGCCKLGLGCAYNGCYTTIPITFTLTETLTTTDAIGNVETTTTTITSETVNSPTSTPTGDGTVPKISPPLTPVPKIAASSTPQSGLSTTEIGGIIGGAGFVLIVILIAAFIIVRRLNRAIKVTEAASRSRTSASSKPRPRPPMSPDVDNMSVDPLMMTPSEFSSSLRGLHTSTHEVDAPHIPRSPPVMHSPFGERGQPYYNGYDPVATTDSNYSNSRNPSMDSTPPMGMLYNPNNGYFDIQPHGRRPSQHNRNWSDASSQSQISPTPSTPAELDAGQDGQRSAFQRALQGMGMGRLVSRRRSEPAARPGRQTRVQASQPVVLTGGPVRLGHIPEAGESSMQIDKAGVKTHVRDTSETLLINRNPGAFVVDSGLEYGTGVPEMRETGRQ